MRVEIERSVSSADRPPAEFTVTVRWCLTDIHEQSCWRFYGAPPLFVADDPDEAALFPEQPVRPLELGEPVLVFSRVTSDVRSANAFIDQVRAAALALEQYWQAAQAFHGRETVSPLDTASGR